MLRYARIIGLELKSSYVLLSSKRFKGHSHYQNIRHTKETNDQKRSQLMQKYMWRLQGIVNANKGDANIQTNPALANTLEQAKKDNLPVTTLVNFLKKICNRDIDPQDLYLKGSDNYVIVITYDRKRQQYFRQAIKKACRDNKMSLVEIAKIDDVYTVKGIIVSQAPSNDMALEKAEEDAIVAGAEEVEELESTDKDGKVFQFITLQEDLWNAVKTLKDMGWVMYEHRLELVPMYLVELPEEKVPQLNNLITSLESIPEVEKVVINVA